MKRFAVADPTFDPLAPLFLEASAGTGKTYSIERLVVRLLLESEPPIELDRILVVTFTRAAARELKGRITRTLHGALAAATGETERRRLHAAMSAIDEAKVFTIHAFCLEMLQSHAFDGQIGLQVGGLELGISYGEQVQVAKDLFRAGLTAERYSEGQIAGALGLARGDPDRLARLILRQLGRGLPIEVGPTFEESRKALSQLLKGLEVNAAGVEADFERLWPHYVGLANRQRELKEGLRESVTFMAALLDGGELTGEALERLIREPCVLLDLIACGKPKKGGGKVEGLRHPELLEWLREEFGPELERARGALHTLARLAADTEQMLERRMEEQERLTFGGILRTMERALDHPAFAQAVQDSFDAAIVDEFQDTDPVQWAIFERLFAGRDDFPFVLVGDPKQSIYAFRGADLATYLRARDSFDQERRYSLGVNYRSRPGLVAALNRLFGGVQGLDCPPVEAGVSEDNALSSQGAIQLFDANVELEAFAFICSEIEALHQREELPYSHFAVLIADRFQAERLRAFAHERGLPCAPMRGKRCGDSLALAELCALLEATFDPSNGGKMRLLLAGRLGGWARCDEAPVHMRELHALLVAEGFLPFFEGFLETRFGERTVAEQLLATEEGGTLFLELRQIAAALAHLAPEELLPYLQQLALADEEDEGALKLFPQSDESRVHLLTTFASKGLEYGVVFALGLAPRKRVRRTSLNQVDGMLTARPPTESAEAEQHAEALRLLYVALTRAKDRVYVARSVEELVGSALDGVVEAKLAPPMARQAPAFELLPPPEVEVKGSNRCLQSFTRMARPHQPGERVLLPEGERSPHNMPVGARTGLILHELLETGGSVAKSCRGTHLEGWEETVEAIVQSCWRADLGGFCLEDVERHEAEMEFLYGVEEGCIGGVIDLFFVREGKFYLLDWKTNWLGPDISHYDEAQMRREMERHDYTLQARLYREALERYFGLFDGLEYGGAYYLFVRGVPEGRGVLKI